MVATPDIINREAEQTENQKAPLKDIGPEGDSPEGYSDDGVGPEEAGIIREIGEDY